MEQILAMKEARERSFVFGIFVLFCLASVVYATVASYNAGDYYLLWGHLVGGALSDTYSVGSGTLDFDERANMSNSINDSSFETIASINGATVPWASMLITQANVQRNISYVRNSSFSGNESIEFTWYSGNTTHPWYKRYQFGQAAGNSYAAWYAPWNDAGATVMTKVAGTFSTDIIQDNSTFYKKIPVITGAGQAYFKGSLYYDRYYNFSAKNIGKANMTACLLEVGFTDQGGTHRDLIYFFNVTNAPYVLQNPNRKWIRIVEMEGTPDSTWFNGIVPRDVYSDITSASQFGGNVTSFSVDYVGLITYQDANSPSNGAGAYEQLRCIAGNLTLSYAKSIYGVVLDTADVPSGGGSKALKMYLASNKGMPFEFQAVFSAGSSRYLISQQNVSFGGITEADDPQVSWNWKYTGLEHAANASWIGMMARVNFTSGGSTSYLNYYHTISGTSPGDAGNEYYINVSSAGDPNNAWVVVGRNLTSDLAGKGITTFRASSIGAYVVINVSSSYYSPYDPGVNVSFDLWNMNRSVFRVETQHNSTATSDIGDVTINSVNATVIFNSTYAGTYQLMMYNWVTSTWTSCGAAAAVTANVWTTLACTISSSASSYRSTDANKYVKITLNETTAHSTKGAAKIDYLQFFIDYTGGATPAALKIADFRVYESSDMSNIGAGTLRCNLTSSYGSSVASGECASSLLANTVHRGEIQICNDVNGGSAATVTAVRHNVLQKSYIGSLTANDCGNGDTTISALNCDWNSSASNAVYVEGGGVSISSGASRSASSCQWFVYRFTTGTPGTAEKSQSNADTTGASSGSNPTSGTMNITVLANVEISIPQATSNFGSVSVGASDDTTDDSPSAMIVRNDGSVAVDITVNASSLFVQAVNPASNYQYKVSNSEAGSIGNLGGSATAWTNVPASGSPALAIAALGYTDTADEARVDLKIVVPSDETPGSKSSTITFTASQS
ncbi:MAG: hypothetical protein ABIH99_05465 [Candidatus Micrarchaeota archaeon]